MKTELLIQIMEQKKKALQGTKLLNYSKTSWTAARNERNAETKIYNGIKAYDVALKILRNEPFCYWDIQDLYYQELAGYIEEKYCSHEFIYLRVINHVIDSYIKRRLPVYKKEVCKVNFFFELNQGEKVEIQKC